MAANDEDDIELEEEPTDPDAELDDELVVPELDEAELDEDELEVEPDEFEADELEDDDAEIADEEEDDDDESETTVRARKRKGTGAEEEEEEDDDDLVAPDDVEADLDRILKDRMVASEDENEDEDEEAPVDDRGDTIDGLQPKRADETLCSSCFLLVRSTAPGCPVEDDNCPIFH